MTYPINKDTKFNKRIDALPRDIYTLLSQIDQLKGRWVGGVGFSSQILGRLKKFALVTSAGASTRIEGSQMSDEEVRRLVDGLKVTTLRERDAEEVKGYVDAWNFIHDNYQDIELTENHIKEIHQILLKYSSRDASHRGEYKHMPNDVVAKNQDGQVVGVVFKTMPPLQTPFAMEELVAWLNYAAESQQYHPLLIVASFVVEFLRIHPFIDGNGRMSRLLTDLLMLKNDFSYIDYVSMERIIEEEKADYYIALRKSQNTFDSDAESIEDWTRFFLSVCLEQAKRANSLISEESLQTHLSKSQLEVYQIAASLGEFAIRDIEARTQIPRPTIKQAIEKLLSLSIIEAYGAGRSTRYKMKKK